MEFGPVKNRVKPFGLLGLTTGLPGGGDVDLTSREDEFFEKLGIEAGSDLHKIIKGEYEIDGIIAHIEELEGEFESIVEEIEEQVVDKVFTEEQQQSIEEVMDEIETEFEEVREQILNDATETFGRFDESCL